MINEQQKEASKYCIRQKKKLTQANNKLPQAKEKLPQAKVIPDCKAKLSEGQYTDTHHRQH
jgi:hypothetical protein